MCSLRISRIVYGRERRRNRVYYAIDPTGVDRNEKAIPEQVVLKRWRRRKTAGRTFYGSRLSPTLWRALVVTLDATVDHWQTYDLEDLTHRREDKQAKLRASTLSRPPSPTILQALIAVCGVPRLKKLVERHSAPEHAGRSGVPDLFLFARDRDGAIRCVNFVEVKKPNEPVSRDQQDEIEFMQRIGLPVRVFRLTERSGGRPKANRQGTA